jgi:hypothetical protein
MRLFPIVAAVLGFCTSLAQAESEPRGSGSVEIGTAIISIEANAERVEFDAANRLPEVFVSAATGNSFGFGPNENIRFSAWGVSGAVEAIVPLDDYGVVDWAFVSRVEGTWAQDSSSNAFTVTGRNFAFVPIDGTTLPAQVISGFGDTALTQIDLSYQRWEGFLGAAQEVFGGTSLLKFGVYSAFGQTELNSVTNGNGPGVVSVHTLDETVDVFSVGPQLSLEGEIDLSTRVELFAQVSGALLYAHGDFDARQSHIVTGGGAQFMTVADSTSDFAALFETKAGFNVRPTDQLSLTLFAAAQWRNDQYEILNPTVPTPQNAFSGNEAARIRQTELTSFSLGGALTIKLN